MAPRNRHMNMLIHNGRSDDTTSRTSQSTESKTQGSYNWRRNDPPLPKVDTMTPLQMWRSEELHANKLWQRIQALEAQIIEYNKSKYDKISTNGQRGKNILHKSKHTLSTQDQINQGVVAAFLCESVWPCSAHHTTTSMCRRFGQSHMWLVCTSFLPYPKYDVNRLILYCTVR